MRPDERRLPGAALGAATVLAGALALGFLVSIAAAQDASMVESGREYIAAMQAEVAELESKREELDTGGEGRGGAARRCPRRAGRDRGRHPRRHRARWPGEGAAWHARRRDRGPPQGDRG